MTLLEIAVKQAAASSVMTFEQVIAGCTQDEREQLAWYLAQLRARRTWEALRLPTCAAIPIDPEREANCGQPWHWDDGIPYCDICGLYRSTVHKLDRKRP